MGTGWGRIVCALAALALAAGPAGARAEVVQAQIDDEAGKPVADAVMALLPDDPTRALPEAAATWRQAIVDQRDETFLPYVTIVAQGGSVVFHNGDTPHHHVYSFSPTKAFEFVLKPGESSAPVLFDKPGVAAIGCNIHDQMIAYVYVSETPWVGLSDKAGQVRIDGVPAGVYTARVWHPSLRPGAPPPSQPLTVADAPGSLAVTLALLPPKHRDREHGLY